MLSRGRNLETGRFLAALPTDGRLMAGRLANLEPLESSDEMNASGSLNPAGCNDKVHCDLCGRQRGDPGALAMKRIEKTIQYSSCFPIHEGFMTNRTNVGRNITDCDPYQRTPPFEGLQSVSRLCCARTFARTSCSHRFLFFLLP